LVKGLPVGYESLAGGSVRLSAGPFGDLIVEAGSLVDVSGSPPVENFLRQSDRQLISTTVASGAGSLMLSFSNNLILDGQMTGKTSLSTVNGGSLTIKKTAETSGLTIRQEDLLDYTQSGFDALTLDSPKNLAFAGPMDMKIDRSLSLNTPEIRGVEGATLSLSAPWVTVSNTHDAYQTLIKDDQDLEAGSAALQLSGTWIDVAGHVVMSGFKSVSLEAERDMRFSDAQYVQGVDVSWNG
jgi:hypothetical protein